MGIAVEKMPPIDDLGATKWRDARMAANPLRFG